MTGRSPIVDASIQHDVALLRTAVAKTRDARTMALVSTVEIMVAGLRNECGDADTIEWGRAMLRAARWLSEFVTTWQSQYPDDLIAPTILVDLLGLTGAGLLDGAR